MRLTFVTGNPGKLAEAKDLLAGIAQLQQDSGGYMEPQVDTLEEVARHGLDEVGRRIDPPFFLEDAGLFVDALSGFPGVFSAYTYRTIGWEGILRLLHPIGDKERGARFTAVIGYRDASGNDHLFRGDAEGRILHEGRGKGGFGFDPIFAPKGGDGRSFAQMEHDEKATFSHRGAALRAFVEHLGHNEDSHEKAS